VFDNGLYSGRFGGPTLTANYGPSNPAPNMAVRGVNADGTPGTTSLSFGSTGIVVNGENATFSPTLPTTSKSFFGGAVSERELLVSFDNGATETLTEITVTPAGGTAAEYVRQFVYSATDQNGLFEVQAFMTIGSDTPLSPGATIATYSGTTYGNYVNVKTGTTDKFYGTGVFKFDMATGDWSGTIADLDFVWSDGPGTTSETASDGRDFGLNFTGGIGADNSFSGSARAIGIMMGGPVRGSFFGAKDGLAVEIGGQYYMLETTIPDGLISFVQGGFLGKYQPMVPGAAKAGGTVDDYGFVGDFRGPIAGLIPAGQDGVANELLLFAGTTNEGQGNPDVVVTLSERTGFGDEPRVDIVIGGNHLTFDLNDADPYQYRSDERSDFVVERYVLNVDQANDRVSSFSLFNFNLGDPAGGEAGIRQAQYARLAAFENGRLTDLRLDNFLFMTFGANLVQMPTTGSATFDTGLLGYYLTETGASPFTSRGNLLADFGALTLTGNFDPVAFGDYEGRFGESPGVDSFGLRLDASIVGDDFRGTMTATGADMTGPVFGDFYGAEGEEPTELGGTFAISGEDGAAFGGFVGVTN